jgi:hypothetical protein
MVIDAMGREQEITSAGVRLSLRTALKPPPRIMMRWRCGMVKTSFDREVRVNGVR